MQHVSLLMNRWYFLRDQLFPAGLGPVFFEPDRPRLVRMWSKILLMWVAVGRMQWRHLREFPRVVGGVGVPVVIWVVSVLFPLPEHVLTDEMH